MKKITVVTEYIPSPINKHGTFKRLGSFLDAFKETYVIDFLFFTSPNEIYLESDLIQWIKEVWGIEAHAIFECSIRPYEEKKSLLNEYLLPAFNALNQPKYKRYTGLELINFVNDYVLKNKPDLIFGHRLTAMCPFILSDKISVPIIFDLDDIEHKVFYRKIASPPIWLSKYLWYLQIPALMWLERKAIKLAKQTFVCSEQDVDYLSNLYGVKKIHAIPNCIKIPEVITALGNELAVLFLGTYNYKPNVDAAEYLITEIWPLIVGEIPEAKLYISGNNPHFIPSYSNVAPNVIFTGFVEDLDALYAKSRVVCCPIFVAGGTRIKIIEAAAYGKAIVASEIGAEGLDLVDGQEIILKNTADKLANACIALLQNDAYALELGIAARERVAQRFDLKNIVQLITRYISELQC